MARRLALDVLYEADIKDLLPLEVLGERKRHGWELDGDDLDDPGPDSIAYAEVLVTGVQDHQADLDELISRYAEGWTIDRMPVVDRTLVRMAAFEVLWGDDVPVAVAINEAVELAKSFSTDDSGRFVNGLLGRIVESHTDPP